MAEAAVLQQEQWLAVPEAFPELQRRAEARTAQYLGGLALLGEVQVEPVETEVNKSTLLAAIQLAALGDEASLKVVKNNVSTDVVERLFKVASQTKVQLQVNQGCLFQEGVAMADIHRNTFLHTTLNPEMRERTTGELQNGFVFEELLRAGVLDTHDALVCEPCPEDEKTLRDYNFFTETDSMPMQLLSVNGSTATLETAFVAGKTSPTAGRHDLATLQQLAQQKGLELLPTDVNGVVRYVVLLPKQAEPRHIEDVVSDFDDINDTFYGQAKPRQDYQTYATECYERNQSFDNLVEAITAQLLADAPAFETPFEAIERLDYLSERMSVKRARTDTSIEAAVFGPTAAFHIEEMRRHSANGDEAQADKSMRMAQKTANSGSCPMFKGSSSERNDGNEDGPSSEKSKPKWMSCPYCDAKVFADPCASVLKCWDCKASVINGTTFKGNGGSKKRRAEAKQKLIAKKQPQAELAAV